MDSEKSTIIEKWTSNEKGGISTGARTNTRMTTWKGSEASTLTLFNSNLKSFAITATP